MAEDTESSPQENQTFKVGDKIVTSIKGTGGVITEIAGDPYNPSGYFIEEGGRSVGFIQKDYAIRPEEYVKKEVPFYPQPQKQPEVKTYPHQRIQVRTPEPHHRRPGIEISEEPVLQKEQPPRRIHVQSLSPRITPKILETVAAGRLEDAIRDHLAYLAQKGRGKREAERKSVSRNPDLFPKPELPETSPFSVKLPEMRKKGLLGEAVAEMRKIVRAVSTSPADNPHLRETAVGQAQRVFSEKQKDARANGFMDMMRGIIGTKRTKPEHPK